MIKKQKTFSRTELISGARKIMVEEARSMVKTSKGLGAGFIKAINAFLEIKGKVVVIGIGKSGIIGRKIAATLSSTGTPSMYLHPVECLHGDMGIINKNDIILMLSYSGETPETNKILPFLKSKGLVVIAITKNLNSKLAKRATITIPLGINKEACPHNIVPTSSTTCMLALGDAIAITLMKINGFDSSNFASLHPGGNLGKLLNTKVKDIMHKGKNNPVINESKSIKQALVVMTKTKAGAVSVVDSKGRLKGFFTDGDLRRFFQKGKINLNTEIKRAMTANPITVYPDTKAIMAAKIIASKKIDNMPVINPVSLKPVGILDERDLLDEGLV